MKKTVTLLALIILAIVLIALTLLTTPDKVAETLNNSNSTNQPLPTANYTGWKNYQSSKYGYTFYYPHTWNFAAYREDDPSVLFGSHTLSSYDMVEVQKYMNHGIVDWKKFLGNKAAVKVDLTVQNLINSSQSEFLQTRFSEATKISSSDLQFGDTQTSRYDSTDQISNKIIRSYIAFPKDTQVVTATVFVENIEGQDFASSSVWQELKQTFQSFNFQ